LTENVHVRRHARARRLKLKVRSDASVEVVAPRGVSRALIGEFVARNSDWLERAVARAREEMSARGGAEPYPEVLELRAFGRQCPVNYQFDAGCTRICWREDALDLALRAREAGLARKALVGALRQRARVELEPRVAGLAARNGVRPARVTWRNQSSRWGSCSSRGSLSLNVRLLFLPPELVDYVLVHELAHLTHPDHSPAFWGRVEQMLPGSDVLRARMRTADQFLPGWILRRD